MYKRIMTAALAVVALGFTSCDDDDDVMDGTFDRSELLATSNANGNITIYDFSDGNNVETTTLTTNSSDNEGIKYNPASDEIYFASRSDDRVYVITGADAQRDGLSGAATGVQSGPQDLESPREIAISGNTVVVADSDDDTFYVYTRSGDNLTLRNELDLDFEVWGIDFVGNDLYAVVDQTNQLAIFTNFINDFRTDGDIDPSKTIAIEGIVRTHGIFYDADDNVLLMTDIGSAMSDSDGGIHYIDNAVTKINGVADGGMLMVAGNQVRTSGTNTLLGNPVDVAYDNETNTIFVAEKANGGGRILGFNNLSGGNLTPSINNILPGASSVDFYSED